MKKFALNCNIDKLKPFFIEEGYLYIKDLFSSELIQRIRNKVLNELYLPGEIQNIS
ncbi:hypothetical protein [Candidatus Protochlamydia amoebophila]|uniref:Uncharacterized protein n=1 Tax=Candidatus Protochlamydia amoebophila TaxID=362787 RepID=A0A0C1K4A8_9BACT|nr:hypothetical protein [Candidatus Protochlamydia amoebophila]KIC74147.1 hypothetical protein DB44_AP00010 [Candidatus Protochlamydia amoebophila]